MKKLIPLLVGLIMMLSCKKDENSSNSSKTTLTYEVIVGNNKMWWGSYMDEANSGVSIYENQPAPSYWKISFNPHHIPFTVSILVVPKMPVNDNNFPNITINLYVNDKLVKTTTTVDSPSAYLQYFVW